MVRKRPFLIAKLLIVAGLGSLPTSVALAELNIAKECYGDPNAPSSGLTGDRKVDNFNLKCDQQRMMQEGNNIHVLSMAYTGKKLSNVVDKLKKDPSKLNDYIAEKTCLQGDTVSKCIERLTISLTGSRLMTREEKIRMNNGRADLVPRENVIRICSDGEEARIGKGGCVVTNSKDLSNNRVTKDFQDVNKFSKTPGAKGMSIQDLFKVQNVNFNAPNSLSDPKFGENLLNPKKLDLNKAQNLNLETINKDLAAKINEDKVIELGSEKKNESLKKALEAAQPILKKKIEGDQKLIDQELKAQQALPPAQRKTANDTSLESFQETMDSIEDQAQQDDLKKTGGKSLNKYGDAVNQRDVHVVISDDGKKPGLDKHIQEAIDDIKNNPN